MNAVKNSILLAGALVVLTGGASQAGETVIYRGTEIYGETDETLTALPTGDTVILERGTVVLTSEASPEGGLEGKCLALGLLTETGDDSREAFCLLYETEDDSLVLKASRVGGEGTIKIVGGSGKWQGATGAGSFKVDPATESVSDYELRITTP